jgi:hypothetical protein
MALEIQTAGTGVVRDAHYVTPTGASTPVRTLLLEPQRTNLCIRSQDWTGWSNGGVNVTLAAGLAPDGTLTANELASTSSTANTRFRSCTFTGDGEKCVSIHLKAGTAVTTGLALRDTTAAVTRHRLLVTWTAGVPSLATEVGAGTIYPVVALGNGWYRLMFSATGVVAANTNAIEVYPDRTGTTGTVLAWGAQAENAVVPSSYIPTEATTVTRNADSLYWDIPALVPREMTVYVRSVNVGFLGVTPATTQRLVNIGSALISDTPRLAIYGSLTNALAAQYNPTGTNRESALTAAAFGATALLDVVEVRVTLSSAGAAQLHATRNAGSEVSGAVATAEALPAAWAQPRLNLGSGLSDQNAPGAYTHAAIALGTKTRAEMRAIAGVP